MIAPMTKARAKLMATTWSPNSFGGSTGSTKVRCRRTNPVSSATDSAARPSVPAEAQRSSRPPRVSTRMSVATPATSSSAPHQSMTAGRDLTGSRSNGPMSDSTPTPMRAVAQKAHRQPGPSTKKPPSGGPRIAASAKTLTYAPW